MTHEPNRRTPGAGAMRFTVTAVERYRDRHAPDLSMLKAEAALCEAWSGALRMRERTTLGQEKWLCRDLGVVLVVKRDAQGPVAVTVLAPPAVQPGDLLVEEMADHAAETAETEQSARAESFPPLPELPRSQEGWEGYARTLGEQLRSSKARLGRVAASREEEARAARAAKAGLRQAVRYLMVRSDDAEVAALLKSIEAVVPFALSREFLEFRPRPRVGR